MVVAAAVWDELADKLLHAAILHGWSNDFIEELRAALKGTNLTTQERWVAMMKTRMAGIRGVLACSDCKKEVPLSLKLSDESIEQCSSCDGAAVGPQALLTDPSLRIARAAQTVGLTPGHNCATAMFESFDLLCRTAVQVTVIDRFSVTDAIRQDAKSSLSSGLQKFIVMADDAGVSDLHIYAAEGGQVQHKTYLAADLTTGLASILTGLQLNTIAIHLHVVSAAVGLHEVHDRWLGFSWPPAGLVSIHMGKGFAQFDGISTKQHFGLSKQDDPIVTRLATRLAAQETLYVKVN